MLDIIGVGDTNVDVMIRVPHIASHDEKVRGQLTHLPRSAAAAAQRFRRSVRISRFSPPPRQWNTKWGCFFRRAWRARFSTSSGLVKDRGR